MHGLCLSNNGQAAPSSMCESDAVYNYMWGPTEFNAPGTLKNFDKTGKLHPLKPAALFIAGRYNEVRPESIYKF